MDEELLILVVALVVLARINQADPVARLTSDARQAYDSTGRLIDTGASLLTQFGTALARAPATASEAYSGAADPTPYFGCLDDNGEPVQCG